MGCQVKAFRILHIPTAKYCRHLFKSISDFNKKYSCDILNSTCDYEYEILQADDFFVISEFLDGYSNERNKLKLHELEPVEVDIELPEPALTYFNTHGHCNDECYSGLYHVCNLPRQGSFIMKIPKSKIIQ